MAPSNSVEDLALSGVGEKGDFCSACALDGENMQIRPSSLFVLIRKYSVVQHARNLPMQYMEIF